MNQFAAMTVFLKQQIQELKHRFPAYRFDMGKVGARMIEAAQVSPMWGSIFVIDPQGVSIGRLLYSDEGSGPKFSHRKAYGENKGYLLHAFWDEIKTCPMPGLGLR